MWINFFLGVFSGICIFFLVLPFLGVVLSRFAREKISDEVEKDYDFACIITAYQHIYITKPLVESLLQQNHQKYHIYLVADDCAGANYDLVHPQLKVLFPNPALKLKAKSIIYAVERYVRQHDFTVIFDADNLAHPDFLSHINTYANQGFVAIQGQRTAKNLNTTYARLDSLGEFYKNYVDRYVPYLLGSSSVIAGSGMAVQTSHYKNYLYGNEIQQGQHLWKKMLQEDKILQNHLLRQNLTIAFAKVAIVYDEKVTTGKAVETQRSRWLYSYFQNIRNASHILWLGLKNFSFNQFWFGLVTIAPPMFILFGVSLMLAIFSIWASPLVGIFLIVAILVFGANVLWCLYLSDAPKSIWAAIWAIPFFIFRQFLGLFKMRNPNKFFTHSETKENLSVDDILDRSKKD